MAHIFLADLPDSEWTWWKMWWFWYFEDHMWEEDSDDEFIVSLEAALDKHDNESSEDDL